MPGGPELASSESWCPRPRASPTFRHIGTIPLDSPPSCPSASLGQDSSAEDPCLSLEMDSASLCAPCPQMHRGTPPEDTGWTGKCEEGLSHQSPREEAHRPGCSRRSHAGCPQSSHRGVTPTENSYTVFHFLPSVAHQESLTPECKLDFTPHFIAKRNPLP